MARHLLAIVFGVLLLGVPALSYGQVTIDTFAGDFPVDPLRDITAGNGPVSAVYTAPSGVLGNFRGYAADLMSGSGLSSYTRNTDICPPGFSGCYAHGADPFARGRTRLTWDGDNNGANLNATGLGGVDLTSGQSLTTGVGFRVWVLADDFPGTLRLRIYTDANNWSEGEIALPGGINVEPNAGQGVPFGVRFSSMTQGAGASGPANFTSVGAITLEIIGETFHSLDVVLDLLDIGCADLVGGQFVCPTPTPTPSATPTRTPTRTATATATATATVTRTATGTPTRTATPTITRTPTRTATATATSTATATPTRTGTATATSTATNTATHTATATATSTATPTATGTATYTPTVTATATRTGTSTASPTATATATHTATRTATATATSTATATYTPTSTVTAAPTTTATRTATPTMTGTATTTATATASATATITLTPTVTSTATATPTTTATGTATATTTATATNTATATSTATITSTATTTPTATETATNTPTPTVTPTMTATYTPTETPTTTPTTTATSTVTPTSTATATVTATATSTTTPPSTPTAGIQETPNPTPTPGCSEFDTTSILFNLDRLANAQERVVKLAATKIERQQRASKAERNQAQNLVKAARPLAVKGWTLAWTIPTVVRSCTDVPNCVTVNIEATSTQFQSTSNELRALGQKAGDLVIRVARRLKNKGLRRYGESLKSQAQDLYNQQLTSLAQVPKTSVNCS